MTRPGPTTAAGRLTPEQRSIAEDIASGASDCHAEKCGVWLDDGDGCDCILSDAIGDGLIAARIVSLTQELGWNRDTRRGDRTIQLDFNPMPEAEAAAGPPASAERVTRESLRVRFGPPISVLDEVRALHQRQDVATPDDEVQTMCRTCYIFDEGWPCAVARLVAVIDEQLAADADLPEAAVQEPAPLSEEAMSRRRAVQPTPASDLDVELLKKAITAAGLFLCRGDTMALVLLDDGVPEIAAAYLRLLEQREA